MSEDKIATALAEAARADVLLKDEFLWKQFDHLEQEYISAWRVCPARDTDGREKLWQAVNVCGKVKDHLVKVLSDGKLAKQDLEYLMSKQG